MADADAADEVLEETVTEDSADATEDSDVVSVMMTAAEDTKLPVADVDAPEGSVTVTVDSVDATEVSDVITHALAYTLLLKETVLHLIRNRIFPRNTRER